MSSMSTGLDEENLNLKAKVQDLESRISQMLSQKNNERDQLSNQMQGQSRDLEMHVADLEQQLMMSNEERLQAFDHVSQMKQELG